jgi:hypothetical protein
MKIFRRGCAWLVLILMYIYIYIYICVCVCVFQVYSWDAANKHVVYIFVAWISRPLDKLRITSDNFDEKDDRVASLSSLSLRRKKTRTVRHYISTEYRDVFFSEKPWTAMGFSVLFIFPEINWKLPFHRAQSASSTALNILRKLHSCHGIFTNDTKWSAFLVQICLP